MAKVGDSNDPMRDIIAKTAASLDTEALPNDNTEADEPAVETEVVADAGTDEPAVAAEPAVEGDEPAPAATGVDAVTEAAEVAAGKVVEKLEAGDQPAKVVAKTEKEKQIEAFAKEHNLKAKDSLGRENRIPHSIVATRIVPNAIKKAKAEWETSVLKPVNAKVRVYEERLGTIEKTEGIMFGNPRQYLAMLAAGVPGYSQIFDELKGGKAAVEGAKPGDGTKLAPNATDDPEPQPDARDAAGNIIGYTPDGFKKLREWDRREAGREAEKRVEQRFKPLLARDESLRANEQLSSTIEGVITSAASWPGFAENYETILAELSKGKDALDTGPKMQKAVQEAYHTVMFGAVTKKAETEEEARARYFAEFQTSLRKAPRSTSTPGSTVRANEPAAADDAVSGDDRMRNIIAGVASRLK